MGIGPREGVLLAASLGSAIVTFYFTAYIRVRQRRDAALFPNYFGQIVLARLGLSYARNQPLLLCSGGGSISVTWQSQSGGRSKFEQAHSAVLTGQESKKISTKCQNNNILSPPRKKGLTRQRPHTDLHERPNIGVGMCGLHYYNVYTVSQKSSHL